MDLLDRVVDTLEAPVALHREGELFLELHRRSAGAGIHFDRDRLGVGFPARAELHRIGAWLDPRSVGLRSGVTGRRRDRIPPSEPWRRREAQIPYESVHPRSGRKDRRTQEPVGGDPEVLFVDGIGTIGA